MDRLIIKLALFSFAITILLTGCQAQSGTLSIEDVWARPGANGDYSAVYFVIRNPGEADILLSADGKIADAVELHLSTMQDGAMSMQQQENVEIPAHGQVQFAPGGLHIMLIGLKQDLKAGDSFPLTLNFAEAGSRDVTVAVREP